MFDCICEHVKSFHDEIATIVDSSKWHKYWVFSKLPSTAAKSLINSMIMLVINYLEMSESKQNFFCF